MTMWTTKEIGELRREGVRMQNHRPCHVCHLWVDNRNRRRHTKACARRKREAKS